MTTQLQALPLQGFDLSNPQTVKVFQTQLAQILNQIQTSQTVLIKASVDKLQADLKAITAASTSFADFQSRIAAWAVE